MIKLKAKPIRKNKYWIVEDNGEKVAIIQAIDKGGFSYVHDNVRELFPSIKEIKKKFHIEFEPFIKSSDNSEYLVLGWPVNCKPFNPVFNIEKQIPLFTKSIKSTCYYCAGYYIIYRNNKWINVFCPKFISLQRYKFRGPFLNEETQ